MKNFLNDYRDLFSSFDNVFVTSDLHLRHDNVTLFEPIRKHLQTADKFVGTPDEYLIHKWNSQVGPNDLVINLGDLHWKSYQPLAGKLNGTQLLVLGNHDSKPQYYNQFPNVYVVEGVWNLDGIPSEYYTGCVVAPSSGSDKLLSGFFYKGMLFSHYPIRNLEYERQYRNKLITARTETLGLMAMAVSPDCVNVHGHVHSALPEGLPKSINVCIDFNEYNLLRLSELVSDGVSTENKEFKNEV